MDVLGATQQVIRGMGGGHNKWQGVMCGRLQEMRAWGVQQVTGVCVLEGGWQTMIWWHGMGHLHSNSAFREVSKHHLGPTICSQNGRTNKSNWPEVVLCGEVLGWSVTHDFPTVIRPDEHGLLPERLSHRREAQGREERLRCPVQGRIEIMLKLEQIITNENSLLKKREKNWMNSVHKNTVYA